MNTICGAWFGYARSNWMIHWPISDRVINALKNRRSLAAMATVNSIEWVQPATTTTMIVPHVVSRMLAIGYAGV